MRGFFCGIGWGEVMCLTPCELTASVTVLANFLASGLETDALALLAAILVQLGDTLAAIAAQRQFYERYRK